jgi:hypothetical protein
VSSPPKDPILFAGLASASTPAPTPVEPLVKTTVPPMTQPPDPAMARATVPTIPMPGQAAHMPTWSAIVLTAVRGMASAETQAGGPATAAVPVEAQVAVVPAAAEAVPVEARVGDP